MHRNTRDTVLNRFGQSLIELCCTHDIHIVNGRTENDTSGNFTCVANEGKSVVDYVIASSVLFDSIADMSVDEHDFSDHLPKLRERSNRTVRFYYATQNSYKSGSQSDVYVR